MMNIINFILKFKKR